MSWLFRPRLGRFRGTAAGDASCRVGELDDAAGPREASGQTMSASGWLDA